ncbi:hypothetical protein GBAR_LOCUS27581, partial [Geodia barretti]
METMSEDRENEKQENSTEEPPKTIPSQCTETQQLTSRLMIEKSVEEMVSEINTKRTRDQVLLQNFKQDLEAWSGSAHAAIEAAVYDKTVKSSKVIDDKLTELFEALGRIRKLQEEME